jgi:PTH1 family peptidyl-tRNA hydrolase
MTTIIIGLGNPGEKYKNTRHNVGFMVLDKFAKENNFPEFKLQKKSAALISENLIGEGKIILAKPQTFMNESGKTVRKITTNYKLQTTNLIIVHDDIDLEIGKIKIVKERGSAGHKGVESVIKSIGNENLVRIRVGVGSENEQEAMKVVLKNFSKDEQKILNETISKTADALNFLIKNDVEKAMNEYNK